MDGGVAPIATSLVKRDALCYGSQKSKESVIILLQSFILAAAASTDFIILLYSDGDTCDADELLITPRWLIQHIRHYCFLHKTLIENIVSPIDLKI